MGTAPTIEGIDAKLEVIASDIKKGLKSSSRALQTSIVRGPIINIVEVVSKTKEITNVNTMNITNSRRVSPPVGRAKVNAMY